MTGEFSTKVGVLPPCVYDPLVAPAASFAITSSVSGLKLVNVFVIGTQSLRDNIGRYDLVKHATQRNTLNHPGMYPKVYDATCELILNNEHPVAFEKAGFTTKKIHTPEAVLCMTQECLP